MGLYPLEFTGRLNQLRQINVITLDQANLIVWPELMPLYRPFTYEGSLSSVLHGRLTVDAPELVRADSISYYVVTVVSTQGEIL